MDAPLIQVSTLAPFVRAVTEAGLSAGELGGKVGLTPEMLGDANALAPAQSIYRFTELASECMEDRFLGVKLGLDPKILQWNVVEDAFAEAHVVVDFFSRFLLNAQEFTTNVDFRLELRPKMSLFERDRGFTPKVPPAQIDGFSVGLFLTLFQRALGRDWKASDMLFKICDPDVARVPATGNCTLVRGDPRKLTIAFPSKWLIHPLQCSRQNRKTSKAPKPPTEALVTAIRSNIRANISNPNFGVPMLATQMGFNRRDVQRYLRDRGSGLADLIEEERKNRARDLLEKGELTLVEISSALGYSDVSNFSRAFRRWTGVAPSHWRKS